MSNWEIILTNPYILTLGVVLCVLLLFVLKSNSSYIRKRWNYVELIGLLLANIGIFISICDNRVSVSEREMNRAEIEILHVESHIESMISICSYDRNFNTGIYDREVLDLAEEDYRQAGIWIKKYKDSFLDSVRVRKYYNIELPTPPIFKVEKDIYILNEHIKYLEEYISKYNEALKRYIYYNEGKDKTGLEILLKFISPLFIAVSLSINIVSLFMKSSYRRKQKKN